MADNSGLARRALGNPDEYPDEFKSFIGRMIVGNPTIRFEDFQLPALEPVQYVGASGAPAFSGAWANYDATYESAGFYRDTVGRVHLCGTVKSGAAGSTIFTLPVKYRPKLRQAFIALTGAADQVGRIDVLADGEVVHVSGATGYVQLSGISFRAY